MKENYFMGMDGFVWFTGVVEDRNDPSKLGRVKVRCLGLHTESLVDIPTKDLPWAHIMQSTNNPSMQGLGNTPSFLVEGSWVVGFFLDAVEKQQPLIIGSLPGKPTSVADASQGFNDPNAKYPSEKITHSNHSINEPDTNRLAQLLPLATRTNEDGTQNPTQYKVSTSWGLIYGKGQFTNSHTHWPDTWSWTYCVSGCEQCSPLVFTHANYRVTPTVSTMTIFPGWLHHEVPIHTCDHERIMIAGNLVGF